jgi:hypothetical protein
MLRKADEKAAPKKRNAFLDDRMRHAQKRRGNASFPFRDEHFIFRFWRN